MNKIEIKRTITDSKTYRIFSVKLAYATDTIGCATGLNFLSLSFQPSLHKPSVSDSSDDSSKRPSSSHFPPYKPLQAGASSSTTPPPPFPIPPPPPAPRGHPPRRATGQPPPRRPHRSNAARGGGARSKLSSSSSCPPPTQEKQLSPLLIPSLPSSASNSASDLQLSPLQRKGSNVSLLHLLTPLAD